MRKPLSAKNMVTPYPAKSHENLVRLNLSRFKPMCENTTAIAAIARKPFNPGRYNLLLTNKFYGANILGYN